MNNKEIITLLKNLVSLTSKDTLLRIELNADIFIQKAYICSENFMSFNTDSFLSITLNNYYYNLLLTELLNSKFYKKYKNNNSFTTTLENWLLLFNPNEEKEELNNEEK